MDDPIRYTNVYDPSGKPIALASETPLPRLQQQAFYEHQLSAPDYDVCQTKEAAEEAAEEAARAKLRAPLPNGRKDHAQKRN